MVGKPGARSLADDYARSIDSLGVTPRQHVDLLDAFDVAQSLLDAATSDDDPVDDVVARERERLERARLALIAGRLEARLQLALDDAQLQRLYAALGSPQVIAYRLSRERPMQRPAPPTSGAPAAP